MDSTTVWIDDDGPADERYKLFLRNQGGEVHLENAPDGGLVARVRLPR